MTTGSSTVDPRRRLLLQWLSAGSIGLLTPPAASSQRSFAPRPVRLPPSQSIYRLAGTVKVNEREADLSTRIRAGDSLETGDDAELVFVIGGNAMLLRAGSRLEIDPPQHADEASSWIVTGLRLLTGRILSVSRRQPMQVQTAVATIGIRGTGFYAESDPQETYFCTCYGETDIAALLDPSSRTTVAARQHDRPLYITSDGAAGNNIRSAPFKNHDNEELTLIETLVGRTPPFGAAGYRYRGWGSEYP